MGGEMTGNHNSLETETAYCILCGDSAPSVPIAAGWDFEYCTTLAEHLIYRCVSCGTVFIRNRPVAGEMRRIYPENYYTAGDSKRKSGITCFLRRLIETAKVKRYRDLLGPGAHQVADIGCGDGRMLDVIRGIVPYWRLSGIDITAAAAAAAQSKGYQVVKGDIEVDGLPWEEGSLDLVLLHQVLEHTRDPRAVIRRANRLLRKGGLLSIETPDTEGVDFRVFKNRYWGGYHIPRHFYLFNKRSLAELLYESDFVVVSIKSILSPVFWIHSVHNWLVDRQWGKGLAGFFHYRNPFLLAVTTLIELVQVSFFYRSSNMQVIGRKLR